MSEINVCLVVWMCTNYCPVLSHSFSILSELYLDIEVVEFVLYDMQFVTKYSEMYYHISMVTELLELKLLSIKGITVTF